MFFSFAAALIAGAMVQVTGAAQFNVTVGGTGIIAYNPEFVNANVGDTVFFTFLQKNHTVTQSTLANPCQQAPGGFDSGFVPVAADNTGGPFPAAQFTVQDTNPVWVYCRQADHCQQGMVFAINPGNDFATFKANAIGNNTDTSGNPAPSVVTVTQTVTVQGDGTSTTTSPANPSSPSPSSTPTMSTDHKVVVGGASLVFNPSNITAQIGDTITFQFMQKNHTATQSSFATPCQPLGQSSTSGLTGFDSGFMPVAANATTFPTYTIQVNSTTPIWVYCRQANHCPSGMVFAANVVESGPNNFEAFVSNAKNSATSGGSSPPSPSSSSSGTANVSNINAVGRISVGSGAGILGVLVMSFWLMT